MDVNIRKALKEDAEFVGRLMRKSDRVECLHAHGHSPTQAVLSTLKDPDILCATVNGVPAVLFGCYDNGEVGIPWMLATDSIYDIRKIFLIKSRFYVEEWKKKHRLLTNYVYAENTLSVRWLKWIGFSMCETIMVNNAMFIRFEIKGDAHV